MFVPIVIGMGFAKEESRDDRLLAFLAVAVILLASPLSLIVTLAGFATEAFSALFFGNAVYDRVELGRLTRPSDRSDTFLFADALRRKLSGIETELVGEEAPLVVIGRNLQSRLEDAQKLGEQLKVHRGQSKDAARSEVLDQAIERQTALLQKIERARASHEDMIAKTRATLAACGHELDRMTGMGDDTKLIEELARQEAAAEDVMQASRQAMEQAYSALVHRMTELQTNIGTGLIEPSQQLFIGSGGSITEDLKRYEELAEAAHAHIRVRD
jgi:biotin-(acetyl-CoA carboxylase) ligase